MNETTTPDGARRVGVIGGLGPAATSWLYERIVTLLQPDGDDRYPDIVIHSLPFQVRSEVAFVSGNNAGRDAEHMTDELVRSVRLLAGAGAGRVLLPCNTLHALLPEVRRRLGPQAPEIAHMPRLTAAAIPPGSRVLVLGTGATMQLDVYGVLRETAGQVVHLDPRAQDHLEVLIHRAIREGLPDLWPQVEQMVATAAAAQPIDVVVLACTDLDTMSQATAAGLPVVGSLQTLAAHAADWLRAGPAIPGAPAAESTEQAMALAGTR